MDDILRAVPTQNFEAISDTIMGSEFLSRVVLFNCFENSELKRLFEHGTLQTVKPQATIFIEGEPSRGLYVVISGHVSVQKNDGKSSNLFDLFEVKEGQVLGEVSLFADGPRPYTAVANVLTNLFFIDAQSFAKFIETVDPAIQAKFWKSATGYISERYRTSDMELTESRIQLWRHAFKPK
jgi:CRP-like cAMP-binding protein